MTSESSPVRAIVVRCDSPPAFAAGKAKARLPWLAQTGVSLFKYTFQNAGAVTIAFGIVDVGDYSGTLSLALGNLPSCRSRPATRCRRAEGHCC